MKNKNYLMINKECRKTRFMLKFPNALGHGKFILNIQCECKCCLGEVTLVEQVRIQDLVKEGPSF